MIRDYIKGKTVTVSWGAQVNVLFEPSKEITPPEIFTSESDSARQLASKGKYLLVQPKDNPDFVGYAYAQSVKIDATSGVVIKESYVKSAPAISGKDLSKLAPLDLLIVYLPSSGDFFSVDCPDKKVSKKYISKDMISTNFNDVAIVSALNTKISNISLDSLTNLTDSDKNEISKIINDYLNKMPESMLYPLLMEIYNTINPEQEHKEKDAGSGASSIDFNESDEY